MVLIKLPKEVVNASGIITLLLGILKLVAAMLIMGINIPTTGVLFKKMLQTKDSSSKMLIVVIGYWFLLLNTILLMVLNELLQVMAWLIANIPIIVMSAGLEKALSNFDWS